MSDIFKFQKEEDYDEACCEACQITDEYLEIALECESPEELRGVLRGLYEDAHLDGFKQALHNDVNMKIDLLDNIDNEL